VVTFDKVVITKVGIALTVSFQVEMFFDGRIVITWLAVDDPYGLVGLSRGGVRAGGFREQPVSPLRRLPVRHRRQGRRAGQFPAARCAAARAPLAPGQRCLDASGMNASGLLGQHTVSFNYIPNLWQAPAPVQVNLSTPTPSWNSNPCGRASSAPCGSTSSPRRRPGF
jgi:hypothetical protein